MNPKQKKLIWIAGIALAVFYFAPSFINSARRAAFIREQNEARLEKAQVAKSSIPLPASGAAPTSAGTIPGAAANAGSLQSDNLLGIWQGVALVNGYGNCNLRLELRRALDPAQITGFPTMVCVPIPVITNGVTQFNPSAAVLTGKPNDKSVEFNVDKVISKGAGRCSFTSFTVTPFGNDQIAAEWREDACGEGQMVLRRAGK
jgi:hypothetical protein